jgi:hypothetical protein
VQEHVLAIIRTVRHPGSHVAGSLPLHAHPDSERESRDIDLFHDAQAAMQIACAADVAALESAGMIVRRAEIWSDTFRRAIVTTIDGDDAVEIDWAVDAAWRFFPPVADPVMGWRLHDVDLACNKALALAGRSETRDLIDILAWHHRLGLAGIVWAACGKDPGYNPLSLLEQMRRNARIDPGQLPFLKAQRINPQDLKQQWLVAAAEAETAIELLADGPQGMEIGVIFLDASGRLCWPDPVRPLTDQGLMMHRPTVGGCIPMLRVESRFAP